MDFSKLAGLTIPEGNVTKITCDGTVLWEKATSRIPSEYQQVEYILKFNDNSYIDLGFSFDTACTYYINGERTAQFGYVFGAAENSGKLRCMITGGGSISVYGSTGSAYTSVTLTNVNIDLKVEMRKGAMIATNLLNGETKTYTSQGEYTMTSNLYLFAQNYNGSPRYANTNVLIKSFSYYDKNNDLICDLVPCYRKADNKVGMYDCARKIFLTNATGTYDFAKGTNV